jgi:uncharacterized protein YigA (DUF484 family)
MENDEVQTIHVPDIAVREIGALHLQLAVAQQRIAELEQQLAALLATKSPET